MSESRASARVSAARPSDQRQARSWMFPSAACAADNDESSASARCAAKVALSIDSARSPVVADGRIEYVCASSARACAKAGSRLTADSKADTACGSEAGVRCAR